MKAVITDIERASVHDGPGIRTVVFFKGCPLHCVWCHNPECIASEPEVMLYPEKCIGCGQCDKGCYSGARVICGRVMNEDEIFAQILLDKDYYNKDGGVTFSGGEPMLHREAVAVLADMCRENGIGTAIETSLIIFDEAVLKKMDLVMCDFKIWDSAKHEKYTGVSNEKIKENFKKLDALGIPFIARTPIIPGINDTKEEIGAIRDFLKGFKNITAYELLPYHPLGESKKKALGQEELRFEVPKKEKMEELKHYADLSRQIKQYA